MSMPLTGYSEFPFTLPHGYRDTDGTLHREGIMRMANAMDEIVPMKDPRVQSNPAYLVVILLARVVTRLGSVGMITPRTIEGMTAGDLFFLQELYQRINETGSARLRVACPHCQGEFEVETHPSGES